MVRWAALLLLGALALATVTTGVAAGCGYREWACGNGKCMNAMYVCRGGNPACSEGSDEADSTCDKAPSMRMKVGQVTAVRAEYKEEYESVEFQLCDQTSCSIILVDGRTASGTLSYVAFTECNARGSCGKSEKNHPDGRKDLPTGPLVVKVQRRPSELAVWLDGHKDKAATVPVEEGRDLLRLRPHYWTSDLRVQFNAAWEPSLVPAAGDAEPACVNGGTAFGDTCICKPGFSGVLCDQACGPDKFGERCERSCSKELTGAGKGCSGVRFSDPVSGKSTCAAGLQGPHCSQVCDGTRYGAGCSEACGQCGGAGRCDPYTGECYAGCLPGYHGANCKQESTYLVAAPNVTKATSNSVEGSVQLQGNTAGSGSVKFVQVEHRHDYVEGEPEEEDPFDGIEIDEAEELAWELEVIDDYDYDEEMHVPAIVMPDPEEEAMIDAFQWLEAGPGPASGAALVHYPPLPTDKVHGGDWSTGAVVEVKDEESAVPFTVEGLPADSEVELRAVLLDERMRGRPNAPQVRVRTGKGVLRSVAATETSPGSVQVTWQKSDWSLPVVVHYECEAVAGCPGRCGQSGAVQVAATAKQSAMLEGLLPAAQYRVTVRAGRQAESVTLQTALRAPNVTLAFAEVLASNASAFAKWTEDSCLGLGGPWHSYRWQLVANNGEVVQNGSTTDAALHLQGLEPGKKYELEVAVTNTAGASPWGAVNFTTQDSAPSAPLELAAYRWNRTTLSLMWRAPAHPNGQLRNYFVSVDGLPEERVPADSRCAAWPDMVCHAARLPRGRASLRTVVVTATNDKVEQRGDEASIDVDVSNAKPDAVVGLQARAFIDTVHLQWRLPRHLRGDLSLFLVRVTRLGEASSEEVGPDPAPLTLLAREELPVYESVVRGLQANATYSATVRCDATGGSSDASVLFTTQSDLKVVSSGENVVDFGTILSEHAV